jgi:ribosomal protein S18 acetylase RimI-like enzyme
MNVRPITAGEYERAGDVVVAAYTALPGDHMSGGYERELRDVERRSKEAVVLVAEVDGEIIGAVTYVNDPASPWGASEGMEPGEGLIRMLAVDPTFQGGGVGGALVDACVEQARREGKRAMVLHTTPWMTTAHRLYERRGFRRLPERDFTPVPEVPLRAYGLDLPPGSVAGSDAGA